MKNLFKFSAIPLINLLLLFLIGMGCANNGGAVLNVIVEGSGSVSSQPAGINCPSDCTAGFDTGTEVVLTAAPDPGFEFTGWSGGGCSGTAPCTVTLNSDVEVTATFITVRLVYASRADTNGNSAGVDNIWVINQDGTGAMPLTMLTTGSGNNPDCSSPQWSPDNSKIVYASNRAFDGSDDINFFGTTNIWVMDSDGGNNIPLTQIGADQANSYNPQWSPDGTRIIFYSSRALDGSDVNLDVSNIWVMNADGSNPTPLTHNMVNGADNYEPQWSPDGSKIVFYADKDLNPMIDGPNTNGTSNIWVMNADGSNQAPLTQLTASGASSGEPRWSPDGSQILYNSYRSLNPAMDMSNGNTLNVWVVDVGSSISTPLTSFSQDGVFTFVPRFSPDGLRVVFESNGKLDGSDASTDDNSRNIWIMDANGGNPSPLTLYNNAAVGPVSAQGPVYSADGSKIAFRSNGTLDGGNERIGSNTRNIFLINPDGSGMEALTANTQSDTSSFDQEFVNQ